jgi:hypothetical protein
LLAQQGFDPDRPLNLQRVQAWRATLGQKHDAVEIQGDKLLLRSLAPAVRAARINPMAILPNK